MKVFVGNLTVWQKTKLLTALYDNIALGMKYSPLEFDRARELVVDKTEEIRYVGKFYIGVNFSAKDQFLDVSKYNAFLSKERNHNVLSGEKVLQNMMQEIGLASIKPQGRSLLDASVSTAKPYTILSLPKPKAEIKSAISVEHSEKLGVGC